MAKSNTPGLHPDLIVRSKITAAKPPAAQPISGTFPRAFTFISANLIQTFAPDLGLMKLNRLSYYGAITPRQADVLSGLNFSQHHQEPGRISHLVRAAARHCPGLESQMATLDCTINLADRASIPDRAEITGPQRHSGGAVPAPPWVH